MIVYLFILAAGNIILVDASFFFLEVISGKYRDDYQPLHGKRQICLYHLRQLVCLTFSRKLYTLKLLIVLKLYLKEFCHLYTDSGSARYCNGRIIITSEDLFNAARRDLIPLSSHPVSCDYYTIFIFQGKDSCAMRYICQVTSFF